MAVNEDLISFVKEALERGLSRGQTEEVLLRAGWKPDQVKGAMAAFAEVEFPVPVPRPKPYLSAREAFLYLVLFTTLYISAYNLGSLIFQFINLAFPDPAMEMDTYIHENIRWSISSIIVAFPIFLYLAWLLSREIRLDPAKRASKVRRWLTYLTLFVTASILIGDFITLVYNFLGGETKVRFLLKVLTVAGIAGPIFAYYLLDLRSEEKEVVS